MNVVIKKIDDIDHHLTILERTFKNSFRSYEEAALSEGLLSLPEYIALKKAIEGARKKIETGVEEIDINKLESMYGQCAERFMNIINISTHRQKFIVILDTLSAPEVDNDTDERLLSLKERAAFLNTVAEKKKYELDRLPKIKSVELLLQDFEKVKKLAGIVFSMHEYDPKIEKDIGFYERKVDGFDNQIKGILKELEQKRLAEEKAAYLTELEKKSPLVLPDDSLGVYRIQTGENIADILYGEAACQPLPATTEVEFYEWKNIATAIILLLEEDTLLATRIGFKKGIHHYENTRISLDRINDLAMYIMVKEKKVRLSKKIVTSLERLLFDV